MPSIQRLIPWNNKPPVGYGVNWSSSLAQGLVAFFACNEGSGEPINLCSGIQLSANTTNPGAWTQGQNGIAYSTQVSGAGAYYATPSYLQLQPPISLVWFGNQVANPSGTSGVFGTTYTNADNNPWAGCYIQIQSNSANQLVYNASGTAKVLTAASSISGLSWVAATVATGAQAIYVKTPWTASNTSSNTVSAISYTAQTQLFIGCQTYKTTVNLNCTHEYGLIYNRILTASELHWLYSVGPWSMIAPVQGKRLLPGGLPGGAYTFSASGQSISGVQGGSSATLIAPLGGMAISGAQGGITFPITSPAAGLAISGAQGGITFPITSPATGLAISGHPGTATAGPSPGVSGLAISGAQGGITFPITSPATGLAISGVQGGITSSITSTAAGLAISGAPGGAVFPGITSSLAGLAISGHPGTATAGPSPGVSGLAISGHPGGNPSLTITVSAPGLAIHGAPGATTGGLWIPYLYLPYEYTSVPIETGNANPFGIDPEQTTLITIGLTSAD